MAEANFINPDMIEAAHQYTITKRRLGLAIEAAGEIEDLCRIIHHELAPSEYLAASGMASRIKQLSRIILAAISDPAEKTDGIADRLAA